MEHEFCVLMAIPLTEGQTRGVLSGGTLHIEKEQREQAKTMGLGCFRCEMTGEEALANPECPGQPPGELVYRQEGQDGAD